MDSEFIALLERIAMRLESSHDPVWSSASVEDMRELLSGSIAALKRQEEPDIESLKLAFLPTSSIQEISMENGWAEDYLRMAGELDKFIGL